MGVPGLWPYIADNFPAAITNFDPTTDETKRWEFDYVYLDSNPLLHDSVRHIFNLNTPKRLKDKYADLSYEEKETKVFEMFFAKILEVTAIVTPSKLLYIALDGPAPRNKLIQQRERRFGSGQARVAEEARTGMEVVNTSMITPGTEFMHHLSQFMYWKLRTFIHTDPYYKGVTILYDPPSNVGEGEHKIMDYIRSLPEKERLEGTHCMFGPDGDLLFLTLSAHVSKIHLLREDKMDNKLGYYDLVNSTVISEGLVKMLKQTQLIERKIRTPFDVSNDFTLVGFFVGNDFLPKIKMFHKLKDGLSKLFNTYIGSSAKGFLLTKNNKIILDGFSRFVYTLSHSEEKYLAQQASVTAPEPKFLDNTLLKHSKIEVGRNGVEIVASINMMGYRESYYNKAGIAGKNKDRDFENGIHQMCKEYFKNFVWAYLYYVETLPSWNQSYNWHYAPLMTDLATFLNNLRKLPDTHPSVIEVMTFDKSTPALPFEQLLSVLPASSHKLLPEPFRELMLDPDSKLNKAGYYPETFELDCEGKFKDYQCLTLLPFVDYKIISEAYTEVAEKIPLKWHSNEPGKVCTFKWKESGFLADFKSNYGAIRNCKVKVEEA